MRPFLPHPTLCIYFHKIEKYEFYLNYFPFKTEQNSVIDRLNIISYICWGKVFRYRRAEICSELSGLPQSKRHSIVNLKRSPEWLFRKRGMKGDCLRKQWDKCYMKLLSKVLFLCLYWMNINIYLCIFLKVST